jgi:hypothetical protein
MTDVQGLTGTSAADINPEKVAAPDSEKVPASVADEKVDTTGDSNEDAAIIAKKMSAVIDPAIDRLRPILTMITEVLFILFSLPTIRPSQRLMPVK